MKKTHVVLSLLAIVATLSAFTPANEKVVSSKTHLKFFSHTSVEDIEANNYASVSTIDLVTGEVIFSVPMQSFEFKKSLMQKHYNGKDFLHTKQFPKAKLKGKISNIKDVHFKKDGTYETVVEGNLTIKGVTKAVKEKGTITVEGSSIKVKSIFNITLADYGITFLKGKTASNIAKTVEVTVHAEYSSK